MRYANEPVLKNDDYWSVRDWTWWVLEEYYDHELDNLDTDHNGSIPNYDAACKQVAFGCRAAIRFVSEAEL